jgi:cell division protein ZapA
MDAQRIAVLACLHMADRLRTIEQDLSSLKERVDVKTRHLSLLLDRAID